MQPASVTRPLSSFRLDTVEITVGQRGLAAGTCGCMALHFEVLGLALAGDMHGQVLMGKVLPCARHAPDS